MYRKVTDRVDDEREESVSVLLLLLLLRSGSVCSMNLRSVFDARQSCMIAVAWGEWRIL